MAFNLRPFRSLVQLRRIASPETLTFLETVVEYLRLDRSNLAGPLPLLPICNCLVLLEPSFTLFLPDLFGGFGAVAVGFELCSGSEALLEFSMRGLSGLGSFESLRPLRRAGGSACDVRLRTAIAGFGDDAEESFDAGLAPGESYAEREGLRLMPTSDCVGDDFAGPKFSLGRPLAQSRCGDFPASPNETFVGEAFDDADVDLEPPAPLSRFCGRNITAVGAFPGT